ncbi:hypothetical protein P7C70_g5290, partial [Phenoliferia sp. Uapishka_3]
MSLEPIIKQESEYLRNLVARIVAQRPHVVLVERNVSRLALEYLKDANIAVARNVKREIINAVARVTQADVVSSMDKLALEPRLGRCGTFRVQTFVHGMIPGRRKTFMRFEGCHQELGCTIILRGGRLEVLKKVKRVVEMMVLVVYSAKLEGALLADERVIPTTTNSTIGRNNNNSRKHEHDLSENLAPELFLNNLQAQDRVRISSDIQRALDPYLGTKLSASPWVRFEPPYQLARMSEEDKKVTDMRKIREFEETEMIILEEEVGKKAKEDQEMLGVGMGAGALGRGEPGGGDSTPSLSSTGGGGIGWERSSSVATSFSTFSDAGSLREPPFGAREYIDPLKVLKTVEELAKSTKFREAEEVHAEQLALWDAYITQSRDSFDPADHQKLYVLETLACTQTSDRLCGPPTVRAITFYGENDISIGQYVEATARDAGKACVAVGCGRPMLVHYGTWVHGHYRVSIIPEVHPIELQNSALEGQIVLWSYCKKCKLGSNQTAMSEETYRLSFGKYLELCFYPKDLIRGDMACWHNGHVDHVRYMSFRGITSQVSVEEVDLLNIAAPPLGLRTKPEKQLQLRNDEYITVLEKSERFWNSIAHRIASFNYDLVAADRLDESRLAMEELAGRCDVDRRAILRQLERTYEEATNGTEMVAVRRALQNKAVEWEGEFAAFEQRIIPSEKDVRRLTTVQLKRLFSDGVPLSPERRATSSSLAPSIELDEKDAGSIDLAFASFRSEGEESSVGTSTQAPSIASSTTGTDTGTHSSASSIIIHHPESNPTTPSINIPIADPMNTSHQHSAHQSSGNESDSTVCAVPTARISVSPFSTRRRRNLETSAGESEHEEVAPVRRRTAPTGVASLVNFFSSAADAGAGTGTALTREKTLTPTRPSLRRGATDKPKSTKGRLAPDMFSDGDSSYAKNVGVSHLSNRAFAEKPSRIPKTINKVPSLAKVFEPLPLPATSEPMRKAWSNSAAAGSGSRFLSTSPANSRPQSRSKSRSGSRSGRSTPAGQHESLDASVATLRPPAKSSTSSKLIKTRGRETGDAGSDTKSGSSKGKSRSSVRELGISRPTTSSANKAAHGTRRGSASSSGQHRVLTIANHFNKVTKEAERERQRKLVAYRGKRARPVAVAHSTVEVFDNVKDAIKEDSDDDESHSSDGADDEYDDDAEQPDVDEDSKPDPSQHHPKEVSAVSTQESFVYDTPLESAMHHPSALAPDDSYSSKPPEPLAVLVRADGPDSSEPPSVPPSPRLSDGFPIPRMSEGESSGNERGSIIKAISNLWTYRGGEFTPLDYPLHASEHLFAENPILVREDEPSSIIAFTLCSPAYRDKLKEQDVAVARVVERSEAFMPDDVHPGDRSSTWGVLDFQPDGTDVEETLRKPEGKHFRLQFEEGTTKFFCKIFFAEQFDALRRNCGCSNQFIESLARCVKWESSGGRSKVDFLKTKDDRFIVKEISRLEMDSLLRFAPAFFDYMSKALFHGLPTLLAKIYGFYRIGLRNPTTGKVMRLDVLVMENLFYERTLAQVYDLKGSTRNRHVQVSPDRPNEVLMDENLVQTSYKNPLYVREASKRFIRTAIHNDSLFLSNVNVMDYSLVVGVDSGKQELVVGIVDFIRTYTWDKVLESWVKDSAFLGTFLIQHRLGVFQHTNFLLLGKSSKPGGPTIVTPKQYKNRFRDAMDAYFLLAPDPWLSPTSLLPLCGQKGAATEGKEAFATDPTLKVVREEP